MFKVGVPNGNFFYRYEALQMIAEIGGYVGILTNFIYLHCMHLELFYI